MTPHDLIQTLLHGRDVEPSEQTQRRERVVNRIVRLELIEKPETLLRERKWQVAVTRNRFDVRRQQALLFALNRLDVFREHGNGWTFEEHSQRQLNFESFTQARNDLRGE